MPRLPAKAATGADPLPQRELANEQFSLRTFLRIACHIHVTRARSSARHAKDKWRVSGRGPTFCKLGSRVVYWESDLRSWAAAQRRRSTSDAGEGPRA